MTAAPLSPIDTLSDQNYLGQIRGLDFRPVFIIGAFGDSYDNDGPFMAHVSRTALPAGRPLAVMVNAGIVPDDYRGLFRSARHTLDGAEA